MLYARKSELFHAMVLMNFAQLYTCFCLTMSILPRSGFMYPDVQAMAEYPVYEFLELGIKKGINE